MTVYGEPDKVRTSQERPSGVTATTIPSALRLITTCGCGPPCVRSGRGEHAAGQGEWSGVEGRGVLIRVVAQFSTNDPLRAWGCRRHAPHLSRLHGAVLEPVEVLPVPPGLRELERLTGHIPRSDRRVPLSHGLPLDFGRLFLGHGLLIGRSQRLCARRCVVWLVWQDGGSMTTSTAAQIEFEECQRPMGEGQERMNLGRERWGPTSRSFVHLSTSAGESPKFSTCMRKPAALGCLNPLFVKHAALPWPERAIPPFWKHTLGAVR